MATDGSNCPEDSNSTDCLLRILVHLLNNQQRADNEETNWDPITFYFTLPISILATIFAFTAIFQGILAAGKGRRKTNKHAIGNWARGTEWHWNWENMTFEARAWVPILREDTIENWIEQKDEQDEAERNGNAHCRGVRWLRKCLKAIRTTATHLRTHLGKLAALTRPLWRWAEPTWLGRFSSWLQQRSWYRMLYDSHPDEPAATWVGFLKEIGLTKLNEPGDKVHLHMQPILADYLPDDLIAAPAYAQVGAIVVAAAVAGADIKETDDKFLYPVANGPGFQFDFRQHPTLGIIGAFSRYGKTEEAGSRTRGTPSKKLKLIMEYSRGQIEMSRDILGGGEERLTIAPDLLKESDRRIIRSLPYLYKQHPERIISKLYEIPDKFTSILTFFLARTPDFIPPMFPRSILGSQIPLTTLALNGSYWADLRSGMFGQSNVLDLPLSCRSPRWKRFAFMDRPDVSSSRNHGTSPDISELWKSVMQSAASAQMILRILRTINALDDIDSEDGKIPLDNLIREDETKPVGQELEKKQERDKTETIVVNREHVIEKKPKTNETSTVGCQLNGSTTNSLAGLSMDQGGSIAESIGTDRLRATTKEPFEKDGNRERTIVKGDKVVLHLCIRLLCTPEKLLEWFSNVTPKEREDLRFRVHSQLLEVEEWSEGCGRTYFDYRTGLVCNTTIALLKAAETTENEHSQTPNSDGHGSLNSTDKTDSGNGEKTKPHHKWPDQDSVRGKHSNTLQYLRDLLAAFQKDDDTSRKTHENLLGIKWNLNPTSSADTMDISQEHFFRQRIRENRPQLLKILAREDLVETEYSNVYHLLRRLAVIVAINWSPKEAEASPMWEQFHEDGSIDTETDDVVIYRYLLMTLLFMTATDSSKMIHSGVWDQIVPVL